MAASAPTLSGRRTPSPRGVNGRSPYEDGAAEPTPGSGSGYGAFDGVLVMDRSLSVLDDMLWA